jgi:hypothetical protein
VFVAASIFVRFVRFVSLKVKFSSSVCSGFNFQVVVNVPVILDAKPFFLNESC